MHDNVSIKDDNITIDGSVAIEDSRLSQDSNITKNNDNDSKDNNNSETHTKVSNIKKVVTEWKIRCTPERAKAARWEKANNLLVELQGILE